VLAIATAVGQIHDSAQGAEVAHKLGQLQPLIVVFPQCMGQLASSGPAQRPPPPLAAVRTFGFVLTRRFSAIEMLRYSWSSAMACLVLIGVAGASGSSPLLWAATGMFGFCCGPLWPSSVSLLSEQYGVELSMSQVRETPCRPRSWANFNLFIGWCVPREMHGPTCIVWANLTPFLASDGVALAAHQSNATSAIAH
jgi:hypothetical protein